MTRTTRTTRRQGTTVSLWLAGALLSGVACRDEPIVGPSDQDRAQARPSLGNMAPGPTFTQVSAGEYHTCGVTSASQLYCWGENTSGQLGDGTTEGRVHPTLVSGGLLVRQVSAGYAHTCAVTTGSRAYCWGGNGGGALGDGTTIVTRLTPVPVAGTRAFRHISAGWFRTCALTTSTTNKIYCWGTGILGNGSGYSIRRTPQLVLGANTYRQVAVENDHACGVSTTYKVLCWGRNNYGQLGNAGDADFVALSPVPVAGTRQYVQVTVGLYHSCAVTPTDKAYCWGFGRNGAVGDGKTYNRFEPRAVVGGLSFERVSAGRGFTCGETAGNRAYCWGVNDHGELGNGTFTSSLTPKAVSGGLFFKQLDAGGFHTCGVAGGSLAWCWGYGVGGQLGNGTHDFSSPSPSRVE